MTSLVLVQVWGTPPVVLRIRSVPQPASFFRRISSNPSPLKSPVPTTCQSLGKLIVEFAPLLVKPPLEVPSHSVNQPLTVSCSRKSLLPSPLKSPTPAICELLPEKKLAISP